MSNCGQTSDQTLRYHVLYNGEGHDIDVHTDSAHGVELRRVVKQFVKSVDQTIKKNRLNFELWVGTEQKFMLITSQKRLIANESVIRLSDKSGQSFNCWAELLVNSEKKFETQVLIEKCFRDRQKYRKIVSIISSNCFKMFGKRLKDLGQKKIEIFDQKTDRFVNLSKKSENIPNGSRIRVNCSIIKIKKKEKIEKSHIAVLKREFSVLSLTADKSEDQSKDRQTIDDSLESSLKRLKISCSSQSPTSDANGPEVQTIPKKSRKKTKSKRKSKTRKQKLLSLRGRHINEELIDYYLSLCLSKCLKSDNRQTSSSDDFWQRVSNKMMSECDIRSMNEFQCQMTFNELFVKYLNVLRSANNPFEASHRLKCFDLLNGTDLKSLLTEANHRLVNELKNKLWNSIKHMKSSEPVDKCPEVSPESMPTIDESVVNIQL